MCEEHPGNITTKETSSISVRRKQVKRRKTTQIQDIFGRLYISYVQNHQNVQKVNLTYFKFNQHRSVLIQKSLDISSTCFKCHRTLTLISEDCIDLSKTILVVRAKVTKAERASQGNDEKVGPVCSFKL